LSSTQGGDQVLQLSNNKLTLATTASLLEKGLQALDNRCAENTLTHEEFMYLSGHSLLLENETVDDTTQTIPQP